MWQSKCTLNLSSLLILAVSVLIVDCNRPLYNLKSIFRSRSLKMMTIYLRLALMMSASRECSQSIHHCYLYWLHYHAYISPSLHYVDTTVQILCLAHRYDKYYQTPRVWLTGYDEVILLVTSANIFYVDTCIQIDTYSGGHVSFLIALSISHTV